MLTQLIIEKIAKLPSSANLELVCESCNIAFLRSVRLLKQHIKRRRGKIFCSNRCALDYRSKNAFVILNCGWCEKQFRRYRRDTNQSKCNLNFCTLSCSARYNNAHKAKGTRRSKLEVWLEGRLPTIYPHLEFVFNGKDAINSELDIYIPELKLAFELNGIFHYEPIYGPTKLASIQNNDGRKFQACLERGIELAIIDTSKQLDFSVKKSQKYLKIICDIIDGKLSAPYGS
jgi:hypothetical protein